MNGGLYVLVIKMCIQRIEKNRIKRSDASAILSICRCNCFCNKLTFDYIRDITILIVMYFSRMNIMKSFHLDGCHNVTRRRHLR